MEICRLFAFVLKLLVMRFLLWFLISINWFSGFFLPPAQLDLARIISPKPSEAIQGTVEVEGTVTGIGFQFAEVSFQNAEAVQDTWFLIDQINQVVVDDILIRWDTNALADGLYHLRVTAYYEDGHQIESIVKDLRIRNYTAIEPSTVDEELDVTPSSEQTLQTRFPTNTPVKPIPTPLPPNELALSQDNFIRIAIFGGLAGFLGLFIIGFWLLIRNRRRG